MNQHLGHISTWPSGQVIGRVFHIHPVETAALGIAHRIGDVKFVRDVDVQISLVLVIGAVLEPTGDSLIFLNGEHIAQVENGLFPVSVLGVRASGETNGLVTGAELNVEPSNQCVDEVRTLGSELVGHTEGKVGRGNSVQVEGDDRARVSDQSLHLHGVNQGLGESDLLHRTVVKAIDIVPDCMRSALF